MKIDAVLTPAEIDHLPERDLTGTTCVVFDVLRATSSIITALAFGAREIYPVLTVDEAWALKARMPDALLGGERHGERIEGFDAGNSPLEYRDGVPPRIITTTTNGTVALRACGHAAQTLAGALLNLGALAAYLRAQADDVLLVCAGTFREAALEDILAAGMLGDVFPEAEFSDSARAALAVSRMHRNDISGALLTSRNGSVLHAKGRADEVRWCARISCFDKIGVLESGAVRAL